MKLEVRCCCQPTKLLGWLPVRDEVHDGDRIDFAVSTSWSILSSQDIPRPCVDKITLQAATYWERFDIEGAPAEAHLALKSEETPVERLRLIRGFEEAR